jgi:hypothetical protein
MLLERLSGNRSALSDNAGRSQLMHLFVARPPSLSLDAAGRRS